MDDDDAKALRAIFQTDGDEMKTANLTVPKMTDWTFQSPVVGWCQRHGHQRGSLTVSIGRNTDGKYCLECYADWVAKHVPMLLPPEEGL